MPTNVTGPLNGLAHVVRPTLIAGIGGTGAAAAQHVKLRLRQFTGRDVHWVAIRAFDTAPQENRVTRLVDNAEHIYLGGFDAQSVIQDAIRGRLPHYSKWLPPWLNFQQVASGAGGIRPIGRLCYFYQHEQVKTAANAALKAILEPSAATQYLQETGVRINLEAGIDIHVVGSLCGGTGSGAFLDLAYDLRRWAKQYTNKEVKVTGHLVLPEAFRHKPVGMRSLEANCYAALQELDYFMNGSSDEGWRVEYEPQHDELDTRAPFDTCYLLSGLQKSGAVEDIDGLTAMIGETLFLLAATEMGQEAEKAAVNTSQQQRVAVDAGGRACCYSSYGMLGVEIPSELLGRSLGSSLARDVLRQLLERAPRPDSETDHSVEAFPVALGLLPDAVDALVPDLLLDLSGVHLLIAGGQEDLARALIPEILVQAKATMRQQTEQNAARQLCDPDRLRAKVREDVMQHLVRPGGFDRCLAYLEGVAARIRAFQQTLAASAQQARSRADTKRAEAEAIDRQGLKSARHADSELAPWREFVVSEAEEHVKRDHSLTMGRHVETLNGLINSWRRIRDLFETLRLEDPLDERTYYQEHRSRISVCPLTWFINLLEPHRQHMIQDILKGMADDLDTWSHVGGADLSGRIYSICTDAIRRHFERESSMTCDRLLVECYGYPSERYAGVIDMLASRARASWEMHETYAHRNNVLEISYVAAPSGSRIYNTLQANHLGMLCIESAWPGYLPIFRSEHGFSLIGLKRLPEYRKSFSENLEQRYDFHFFLDRNWVAELPFPDDDRLEMERLRWFSLSECLGALNKNGQQYTFSANGGSPVMLAPYRSDSYASFCKDAVLSAAAKKVVEDSGILERSDDLQAWIDSLISKLTQAQAATEQGTRRNVARPRSLEVSQVHQEVRAVRAGIRRGGEGL